MIDPDVDTLLASVIAAVERDIAPAVTEEYAASLCRTVAQMLRGARARIALEQPALSEDNAELRALLADLPVALPLDIRAEVDRAVRAEPPERQALLADLRADAIRLRQALVSVIEAVPDDDHPVRRAAREYLTRQLTRERAWQQDAFTGPRR